MSAVKEDILAMLKDDSRYYGDYGKQWLSNSDVKILNSNPQEFHQDIEKTKAMLEGSYFHTLMLEPEKLSQYTIVDSTTRNTNKYKEAKYETKEDILLLQSEVDNLHKCADAMKQNFTFFEDIYKEGNEFEVPRVSQHMGLKWKGKADVVSDNLLIDLKTTSSLSQFPNKARAFGYDSQAYLYQMLFDKPLHFYVVDKQTQALGIYEPTEMFLASGQEKVAKAVIVYNKFFSENAVEDIKQYIHYESL
jgi:hypothetical protein|tara:strand:- start:548 stop:1291 length:744 start_codon:yes stop_codon:yes gene_type:complete